MNLIFERIQSAGHPTFEALFSLYLLSFPPEERRELDALIGMLKVPEMYFWAINTDSQLVGFVIYWKFEGFLYIEHLAVYEDQRRKGIGEETLRKLQKEENPILLEVEIPHDEASTKRVAFYKRAGFCSLPINYFQPPYREGESLLPMMLFSDRNEWDPGTLRRLIEVFHHRVYGAKETGR
ncbi:MAG: GNAT family N-acetyltransferase [Bacteroidetes bacterium]|nr:GNAT family N-acetyltransferase [Bacteroidota bacterium]